MVGRLRAALDGLAWEAVFVDDDSPDGTAAAVRAIAGAQTHASAASAASAGGAWPAR